jgi:hypothetical protein
VGRPVDKRPPVRRIARRNRSGATTPETGWETAMSTQDESFARLRAGTWCGGASVIGRIADTSARWQQLADGSGTYVYDDYSVIITTMPPGTTPQSYMQEFARSPNTAIGDGGFNAVNNFVRRGSNPPVIGDIYDINILGPDNGSVALVALSPGFGSGPDDAWVDVQTISCDRFGSHPENGAREFGFQTVDGGVMFYTRGISRPNNWLVRLAGAGPQMIGWTRMMKGISDTLRARGGTPQANSFRMVKFERP